MNIKIFCKEYIIVFFMLISVSSVFGSPEVYQKLLVIEEIKQRNVDLSEDFLDRDDLRFIEKLDFITLSDLRVISKNY